MHIAVRHVLRRLLLPRHPPHALYSFFAVDRGVHLATFLVVLSRIPRRHPSSLTALVFARSPTEVGFFARIVSVLPRLPRSPPARFFPGCPVGSVAGGPLSRIRGTDLLGVLFSQIVVQPDKSSWPLSRYISASARVACVSHFASAQPLGFAFARCSIGNQHHVGCFIPNFNERCALCTLLLLVAACLLIRLASRQQRCAVELRGLEPLTSGLQSRRSPS